MQSKNREKVLFEGFREDPVGLCRVCLKRACGESGCTVVFGARDFDCGREFFFCSGNRKFHSAEKAEGLIGSNKEGNNVKIPRDEFISMASTECTINATDQGSLLTQLPINVIDQCSPTKHTAANPFKIVLQCTQKPSINLVLAPTTLEQPYFECDQDAAEAIISDSENDSPIAQTSNQSPALLSSSSSNATEEAECRKVRKKLIYLLSEEGNSNSSDDKESYLTPEESETVEGESLQSAGCEKGKMRRIEDEKLTQFATLPITRHNEFPEEEEEKENVNNLSVVNICTDENERRVSNADCIEDKAIGVVTANIGSSSACSNQEIEQSKELEENCNKNMQQIIIQTGQTIDSIDQSDESTQKNIEQFNELTKECILQPESISQPCKPINCTAEPINCTQHSNNHISELPIEPTDLILAEYSSMSPIDHIQPKENQITPTNFITLPIDSTFAHQSATNQIANLPELCSFIDQYALLAAIEIVKNNSSLSCSVEREEARNAEEQNIFVQSKTATQSVQKPQEISLDVIRAAKKITAQRRVERRREHKESANNQQSHNAQCKSLEQSLNEKSLNEQPHRIILHSDKFTASISASISATENCISTLSNAIEAQSRAATCTRPTIVISDSEDEEEARLNYLKLATIYHVINSDSDSELPLIISLLSNSSEAEEAEENGKNKESGHSQESQYSEGTRYSGHSQYSEESLHSEGTLHSEESQYSGHSQLAQLQYSEQSQRSKHQLPTRQPSEQPHYSQVQQKPLQPKRLQLRNTPAFSLRTRNNKRSLCESDEQSDLSLGEFSEQEDSIALFSSSPSRYACKEQQTSPAPPKHYKPAEFTFTLRTRNQSCQKNQKSPSLPTSHSSSSSSLNKKPSPPSTKKRNRSLPAPAASLLNSVQTQLAALMEKHILFSNLQPYPQSVDLAFVGERDGCREFICLWNAHFASSKDRSIGKEEWIWRLRAFFAQLERREFRGYFKYLMLHFVEYGFMSEVELMCIVKED